MAVSDSNQRDIYSISRLNAEARAVLESSFPLLWVEGEVSNLATPRSGHLYFSLKDAHAQVRCALFRGKRQLLRTQPQNGDSVLVRARISFYEARGEFQLLIEHLEPAGAGAAQRAFELLKEKLGNEGLFATEKKSELPTFPQRIGVITSPSGAAIRDVLDVLGRRAPHIEVTIFPTRVQGNDAADEICDALELAIQRQDCDILLLTRGGGAAEDLTSFNDERLARLISKATIPLVSAIGHEIDFTIADFVADRRAPTPSAAAELISPDSDALYQAINQLAGRMHKAFSRQTVDRTNAIDKLHGRLKRLSPRAHLRQQQQRLDDFDMRLGRGMRSALDNRDARLQALERQLHSHSPARRLPLLANRFASLPARLHGAMRLTLKHNESKLVSVSRELHAVSPLATMQRGYSVLRRNDNQAVVTGTPEVRKGDQLEALLADGRLDLQVIDVHSENNKDDAG